MDNVIAYTDDEKEDDIDRDLDVEADADDEHIYPLSDIKIEKGFYTVFELKRKADASAPRIVLDSDFQRENVWNRKRNSELVESVLMGLPLPIFYFSQDKYGRLIVVDGRQRLTALFSYMDGDYALDRLRVLRDLNGKKFGDLTPVQTTRIEDFQIQAHVIIPPTPDRIKYDIFDRVNRGGIALNKQEMRNALYQGRSTRLLNRIVQKPSFIDATGRAFIHDKRMKGKYLITRYLAMHLYIAGQIKDDNGKTYVYKGDIDDYLGHAMGRINVMADEEVAELEKMTDTTLDRVYHYLGGDAFRLRGGDRRTPVNMNVFEMIMTSFEGASSELTQDKVAGIIYDVIDSAEFRNNIANHRDGAVNMKWRIDKALGLRQELSRL